MDREGRAAWRDAQRLQADIQVAMIQADIQVAKIQAEAEEKKREDEIKVHLAKIEETPDQFVIRLKNYPANWLEISGSSSGDFDALVDLIVEEQFMNACFEQLAVYLLERSPKDLVELTTWVQQYLIAHKQQLGGKTMSTSSLNVPNKETQHSLN